MEKRLTMHRSMKLSMWSMATLGIALFGCGPAPVPTGTVTGSVSVKGKPFTDGMVVFFSPEQGMGSPAFIDAQGTFVTVTPIPIGNYSIYFDKKPAEQGGVATPGPPDGVPAEYAALHTSPLKMEVVEGENKHDVVVP